MALKHYTPDKVFDSLDEAIQNGESFVTATDDHRYASFVDWREMDDEDREALFEVAGLSLEDQESVFVEEFETAQKNAIEEGNGEGFLMGIMDDLTTIANWHPSLGITWQKEDK